MKHYFLILLLLSNISLQAKILANNSYVVKYEYINYASTPSSGLERYELLIKGKKAVQALDLKEGITILPQEALGKDALLKVLTTKNIYSFPYRKKIDAYSILQIDSIQKVSPIYTLNPLYERYKELKENYRKWLSLGVRKYKLRVQDSRFPQYPEGIELIVANNRVILARDVRSYKEIPPSKNFLPIIKLFGVAKWGLSSATISYDINYFFPNLIILENPNISFRVSAFEILQ